MKAFICSKSIAVGFVQLEKKTFGCNVGGEERELTDDVRVLAAGLLLKVRRTANLQKYCEFFSGPIRTSRV